ncbi:hypothetical protein GH714_031056 [Hevea brasiliensis]|uniref:Protein kinase domain-containing protein n=1 Tax=Hevea brasiliensis TaxID=3981 RepID=A0A6A6LCS0_HEVBR|nr:hypothetical protein GH714_031056 [Hevea brasiliensis]
MIGLLLLLLPLLDFIFVSTAAQNRPPYTPTESILINCGASSDDASQDGRRWNDTYSGLSTSASFFTVTANNYTLLSNFSAYLAVSAKIQPVPYVFKEFIVTVWDNQELKLTFTPSPSSFAFINGVEIVSLPNYLYTKDMDNRYTFVYSDSNPFFYFDNSTSLETVHRLNVGGRLVGNIDDTGMFRTWFDDSKYIFGAPGLPHKWRDDVTINYTKDTPAYTAPATVYTTKRSMGAEPSVNLKYNLTWRFPVDSAEAEADVFHWGGGRDIPVYKDYVIQVPKESPINQDLWLSLHPNIHSNPKYADAILNGLEIFKLNKSDGNLAGPNPEVPAPPEQHPSLGRRTKSKGSSETIVIVGAVIGGFGTVYKGYIESGSIPAAIKRLTSSSKQGIREFHTEIQMLSKLRHVHLVSLIGYCNDQDEMILVYEYMPHVISNLPKEEVILVEWARKYYQRGALDQIIDPQLKGDITLVSLNKFGEIADSCVRDVAIERPTMGDVTWSLEFALQLHETAEKNVSARDDVSESQKLINTDDDEQCTISSGPMSYSRSTASTGERSTSNYDTDIK